MACRCAATAACGSGGCLFDVGVGVAGDMGERVDLAGDPAHAGVLQELQGKLAAANRGIFSPNRGGFDARACAAAAANGGYWGPFLD